MLLSAIMIKWIRGSQVWANAKDSLTDLDELLVLYCEIGQVSVQNISGRYMKYWFIQSDLKYENVKNVKFLTPKFSRSTDLRKLTT